LVTAKDCQLFLEVTAKNTAGSCSTFLLPHPGQGMAWFSCSVSVRTISKDFLQSLQW
jgi:hypothetical protein